MPQPPNPLADPRAMVHSLDGRARFTVLTARLIRMEWSETGRFEDRASQAFINRAQPIPEFHVEHLAGETRITTDAVTLFFRHDGKAFHEGNLGVEFAMNEGRAAWNPGMNAGANLRGTTRTLDMIDGPCSLEPGILSRDGWAIVDDSNRLVLDPDAGQTSAPLEWVRNWEWAAPRTPGGGGGLDWYLFAHGHDYTSALRDFTLIAGKIPLPPRYVFGAWWSRYWAYTEDELITLVEEFRHHDVPLDVLVIDMDWHQGGWTGYTWNPRYFPEPQRFLDWTNSHGLQITLNLHPADGVGRHEAAFPEFCRTMNRDPARTDHIPFDCTDRRFIESYFTLLHWPLENQGIDFWWMDWQQGTKTATPGLDPLWWLNHLHWKDLEDRAQRSDAFRQAKPATAVSHRRKPVECAAGSAKPAQRATPDARNDLQSEIFSDTLAESIATRRARRPLIFSRWGGLGNHRYPIGFSGDTFSTWRGLAWQPEFTATAGNVGYAYWSHDIGGHQPGPVDPELYTRWVQFAVFSPVLRTHTSKNLLGERRIWASPEREFAAMREAFNLRYRLIPYIYTAARKCYDEALPLCRPLYYEWPEREESYTHPNQYLFGDDLLIAPVVEQGDRAARAAGTRVWLPPGTWTNWFSGETFEGPREIALHIPLEEIPVFARAGAVIPAAPKMRWSSEKPLGPLALIIWPGGTRANNHSDDRGTGRLSEDEAESIGYEAGACALTDFTWKRTSTYPDREGGASASDSIHLHISAASGSYHTMPTARAIELRFVDRWPARSISLDGRDLARIAPDSAAEGFFYDEAKFTIVVRLASAPVHSARNVTVSLDPADEAPLRAGLHGKLKLIDHISALLGEHAPADIRGARVSRTDIIRARGGPRVSSLLDADHRWLLAQLVAATTAEAQAKAEAVARLLAFSSTLTVSSDSVGRIVTTVNASSHGIGLPETIRAEIRVYSSRPWKQAHEERRGTSLMHGVSCRTTWEAPSPPQLTTIRAEILIGGIALRSEESIFPSINGWHVIGPFACPPGRAMETVFEPERRPDPAGACRDAAGKLLRWHRIQRTLSPGDDPRAEFAVDLHEAFGAHTDHAVAYALTHLHSPRDMAAVLALGSDDGVRIWLNGEVVHTNDVERGYGSKQDLVPITLRAGLNSLLLKITQAEGGWMFGAQVQDASGNPADEVEARLDI